MQTFLPYPDFKDSLSCLDFKRLGKQRVEARQIIDVIVSGKKSWSNHPAVNMWREYVSALISYYNEALFQFSARGGNNIILQPLEEKEYVKPHWLGDDRLHLSHKSNLLRKGRERFEEKGKDDTLNHYRNFWPYIADNIPYYWPSKELAVCPSG